MKKLIATLLLVPSLCMADTLVLHTTSKHFNKGNWNENNIGIGYSTDLGGAYRQIGVYRNSEYKTSFYAILDVPIVGNTNHIGLFGGVVSGYQNFYMAGGFYGRIQMSNFSVTVRVVPNIGPATGVAALELGYAF